eukprot:CAMPEP_0203933564 /NCGR_PEP_ID=MMETSP0359-20131031/71721_1 /ASSEMBLY_ACC=CAM_ASM_000338 /TAXON_ID=268821 /ORGANISM="Scrippsiella Hangoei, Strain SHTV-5" /LENGTH=255 /DNA_ID=CAMNT_0050863163 /DNA_START=5 /DNA_END=769 /DNA_ORIENTATION=+
MASSAARVCLVTGASRGIGASIAQRFAAAGDRVILHYNKNAAAAEEVAASLPTSIGGKHLCFQADLALPGAASSLVKFVVSQCGAIDVLVGNHGVYEETPFDQTDAAAWSASFERVLRINLTAPAELAHAAAAAMVARGAGGAIVFVSSRGALRGEPLAPAYGASKAGLNSLTGSLAQALAPHRVRVAAVAPGFVATEMAEPALRGPRGDGIRAQSPFNRVGEPHEIAEAVFYLASEGAAWSSGAVLDCNGASYL